MRQRHLLGANEALASRRLGETRRRVCCVAGFLAVWLNLVLVVLLPLVHGGASGTAVAAAAPPLAWSGSAIPVCTRDGVQWVDAEGNRVPAPPSHHGQLCAFCLPLSSGGVAAPSEIVLVVRATEAGQLQYWHDDAAPAIARVGNPSARPRAPPRSIVL